MKGRSNNGKKLAVLVFLLVTGRELATASNVNAAAKIRAEIGSLRDSLAEIPDSTDQKEERAAVAEQLARSEEEMRANRLYVSLEDLGRAWSGLASLKESHTSASQRGGLNAFDAEWHKEKSSFDAFRRQSKSRVWGSTPFAIRAMAESAQHEASVLFEASKAYAEVTSPESGYYYLGQAKGAAEFSDFCSSLRESGSERPLVAQSIASKLEGLQERTNLAFQPPRSIEKHQDFIRLNSTLKRGTELESANLHAAAVYQYLKAVFQLGMLEAPTSESTSRSDLQAGLVEFKKRLHGSGQDESIAQLYVERAESLLSTSGAKRPQAEASATFIAQSVLPAYLEVLKPEKIAQKLVPKLLTVTLVRWPYT